MYSHIENIYLVELSEDIKSFVEEGMLFINIRYVSLFETLVNDGLNE